MTRPVYILGGWQTDFARNWARDGQEIADGLRHVLETGLAEARLDELGQASPGVRLLDTVPGLGPRTAERSTSSSRPIEPN